VRIHILILLLVAFLLLAVAGARETDQPIRVGFTASLSGELSSVGRAYEEGARLWAGEVNARGGILGRRVELVVIDDASDTAKTADAYAKLASGEAELLLGPAGVRFARAALPTLERNKTPCLFPLGASDTLWRDSKGLAFGLVSPLSEWPAGFFEVIARAGVERVAILSVDHIRDKDMLELGAKWARRFGMRPVLEASVRPLEIASALDKSRDARAEALAVWGSAGAALEAMRAVRHMPHKPRAVYISSGLSLSGLLRLSGRDMEGFFTAVPWDEKAAKAYPGGQAFVESYRTLHGRTPDFVAASAFAGGQLLEAAAAKARSLDKDKLRQALASLDAMTVVGRYGVDPAGMQLRQFPLTVQWQKGKREIVWPEQLRTATPVLAR
jgi:branched-chain amino acid transport system substrate-binding protein